MSALTWHVGGLHWGSGGGVLGMIRPRRRRRSPDLPSALQGLYALASVDGRPVPLRATAPHDTCTRPVREHLHLAGDGTCVLTGEHVFDLGAGERRVSLYEPGTWTDDRRGFALHLDGWADVQAARTARCDGRTLTVVAHGQRFVYLR